MNYTDMTNAIKDYTQNDEVTFSGMIDNFIRATEERVFTSIQMPAHFRSTTANAVSSSSNNVSVDNAVEIYDVRFNVGTSGTTDDVYLLRKDWDFLREAYPVSETTGTPKYYAINSSTMSSTTPRTTITFVPFSDNGNIFVDYYQKAVEDSLTDTGNQVDGTWLSVSFPNTLLHGSLAEAYGFMKTDAGMTNYYEQKFQSDLQGLSNVLAGNPVESPASAA